MNISIVGLGKLGATLAGVLASKQHTVVGVDLNQHTLAAINAGKAPIFEPGLEELMHQHKDRLSATSDYEMAIKTTDITFVIVPTPSDTEGAFSLRYINAAIQSIGHCLAQKEAYHLVVITSTVMPGAMKNEIQPLLERIAGKRCGQDFGLCYNPEFIALGNVIYDMLHPDFLLIGQSDAHAGDLLEALYRSIHPSALPVRRMNFINAELTKLAVNTFVTMKISYANMLAHVCERLEDADASVVSTAIGQDARIGSKYIRGALGYGGPCFPRDTVAFRHMAEQVGLEAPLAMATEAINQAQTTRVADMIVSCLPPGGTVGLLGLAYKPHTNVVERSQGLEIAQQILSQGISLKVYDPAAMENARTQLHGDVYFATSMQDCVQGTDVLIITTAWEEFKQLSPTLLASNPGRTVVIDCWRLLDEDSFGTHATYLTLGRYQTLPDVE